MAWQLESGAEASESLLDEKGGEGLEWEKVREEPCIGPAPSDGTSGRITGQSRTRTEPLLGRCVPVMTHGCAVVGGGGGEGAVPSGQDHRRHAQQEARGRMGESA